ncbi:FAD-linked oxidase C-terminal domain-containing protein, partial [Francisella tularensis]|uniref:FAD-linked oxidase C-terminal domain-containing protein n=1 Tax=Francisella tularensis TaxID=263 RepID=UPI00295BF9D8
SSVLIEDIAVNILYLPNLISDLKELFVKYNYTNAAVFGLVLADNIPFVLTPHFNDKNQLVEYDKFMHALTTLVEKKYNGYLKVEHGYGSNIYTFAIDESGE